jgi:Transmembrane protein 43
MRPQVGNSAVRITIVATGGAEGDMRVRYVVSLPSSSMISVLAKQSGNGFTALTAKNGHEVELAAVGNHSAAELIEGKRKSEATYLQRHGLECCDQLRFSGDMNRSSPNLEASNSSDRQANVRAVRPKSGRWRPQSPSRAPAQD